MTSWLMGTKYSREKGKSGQILIFWDDETGELTDIPYKEDHMPYFYTKLGEKQLLDIEALAECGYVKITDDGKKFWNKHRVVKCEQVDKIHPRSREKMRVTKVTVTKPNYVTNTDTGKGMSQLLLPMFVYNNHIKYADMFNIENDVTLGMPYNLSTLQPEIDWYQVKHHPIYNLKQIEPYKKHLPKRMYDWMMGIFTAPFPQFKEHLVALDIEVDFNYRDALDAFQAVSPISSITLSWYKGDDIHHLTFILPDKMRGIQTKKFVKKHTNHIIRICYSETELLERFMFFLYKMKHKYVVGYNLDEFDIPYIATRMKYLGIYDKRIWGFMRPEANEEEEESKFKKKADRIVKGLKGKFLVDLLPFFSNPSIKNYAFKGRYERNTLDDVSTKLLKEQKYDYEGRVTDLGMDELAYYNAQDTTLCLKLATFDDEVAMKLIVMAMRMAHMTIESAVRRRVSAVVGNLLYRTLHHYNMLAIGKEEIGKAGDILSTSTTGKRYSGAIVLEPIKGVHYNIIVADIASLYPQMIVVNNLCYTTMNCGHLECKQNRIIVEEAKLLGTEEINGKKIEKWSQEKSHHVCTKQMGIYPPLIGLIKDIRVYYYKKLKIKDMIAKVVEQWLKVVINASYGVGGFKGFPFFCGPQAECVTATGRDTLLSIKKMIEDEGGIVYYGDTDSVFFTGMTEEHFMSKIRRQINDKYEVDAEIEETGVINLLHRKKNYVIIEEKNGVLDEIIKGLVGKKRDTPQIIRKAFDEWIEVIKKYHKPEQIYQLQEAIDHVFSKYKIAIKAKQGTLNDYKIVKQLSRELSKYKQQNAPQVRAAKKLVKAIQSSSKHPIDENIIMRKGSFIEYVVIHDPDCKGTLGVSPVEMADMRVLDTNKYIDLLSSVYDQLITPIKESLPKESYVIKGVDSYFAVQK